jgi:hypothetical protein
VGVPAAGTTAVKELRKMLQSLVLPLVNLGRMNPIFGRNLVDCLVSRDGLYGYTCLELSGMLPSLCHYSLLSEATILQLYYLSYWSEKVGVLHLDAIRNETVWNKTKQSFISKGLSMTFDLVKSVAISIATEIMKSKIGS